MSGDAIAFPIRKKVMSKVIYYLIGIIGGLFMLPFSIVSYIGRGAEWVSNEIGKIEIRAAKFLGCNKV